MDLSNVNKKKKNPYVQFEIIAVFGSKCLSTCMYNHIVTYWMQYYIFNYQLTIILLFLVNILNIPT